MHFISWYAVSFPFLPVRASDQSISVSAVWFPFLNVKFSFHFIFQFWPWEFLWMSLQFSVIMSFCWFHRSFSLCHFLVWLWTVSFDGISVSDSSISLKISDVFQFQSVSVSAGFTIVSDC
jgi:hypothetical protein